MNQAPGYPEDCSPGSRLRDSVLAAELLVGDQSGRILAAHLKHLSRGEFGTTVFLPAKRPDPVPAFSHHVGRVISSISKEKVIWPNTSAHVTAMQDPHIFGDRSIRQFPRKPVGSVVTIASTPRTDHAITGFVDYSRPQPTASRFLDFGPESEANWNKPRPPLTHGYILPCPMTRSKRAYLPPSVPLPTLIAPDGEDELP